MPQKTNRRKHPVLLKKINAICRPIGCLLLLFVLNVTAFGQNGRTVTGTVTGDKNEPLAGVTITEKGTGNATNSADDGTYSIRLTKGNAILVYSYVGFASQEIKVENAESF